MRKVGDAIHLGGVAGVVAPVGVPVGNLPPVAQALGPAVVRPVLERHHAAAAKRRQLVAGVEAERPDGAETAYLRAVVGGAGRLATVLDHRDIRLRSGVQDRLQVHRHAEGVGEDHRVAATVPDGRHGLANVDIQGCGVVVNQHRLVAKVQDRRQSGREAAAAGEHARAFRQIQAGQGQQVGAATRVDGQRVWHTDIGGVLGLEGGILVAGRQPVPGHDAVDGGPLLVAEDAARKVNVERLVAE